LAPTTARDHDYNGDAGKRAANQWQWAAVSTMKVAARARLPGTAIAHFVIG
jgi:hypothetical protein